MPLEHVSQDLPQADQPDLTIAPEVTIKVVETLILALNRYIFPEVAQRIQTEINSQLWSGSYASITSAKTLAKVLTKQLQEISHDKHLQVFYSYQSLPITDQTGKLIAPVDQERERRYTAWQNSGVYKIERLAGNIGYLDLRGFAPPELAGETVIAALNCLSNTAALIIDLRQNGGGSPRTVALISTYLFGDQPVHLNDLHWREKDSDGVYYERVQQYWTLPYIPAKRYLNKAVYVLTSSFTFSAAEEFANNLKHLKRATIIGETTGGGANPGQFQSLNEHFGVFIPTGRAVNPITRANWEGIGVEPDLKTSAEQAFKTAYLLALKDVLSRTSELEFVWELEQAIASLSEA